MKQVNLEKFKQYEGNETFKFKYVGSSSNDFDEDKVEGLIDAFLEKENSHCDILRNIVYIRTILRTAKEKLLVVKHHDRYNEEIVRYNNGILFSYESKKYNEENQGCMEVKFTPKRELKISFLNFENECIIEYPQVETTNNNFNKVINRINSLRIADSVYIDNDAKILIEIYKLFYNENPDFTKDDINVKVQTMMSILAPFNISFGDYSFNMSGNMPESLVLLQMVNNLFPLGEVDVVDESIELKDNAKKTIKTVGETIRETSDNKNLNQILIAISSTIYSKRYDIDSLDHIKYLSEVLNIYFNNAESSTQLGKKVKGKTDDNKKKNDYNN